MNDKRPSTPLGRAHPNLTLMAKPAPPVRIIPPHERPHAVRRHQHLLDELDRQLDEWDLWIRRRDVVWFVAGVCTMALVAIALGL